MEILGLLQFRPNRSQISLKLNKSAQTDGRVQSGTGEVLPLELLQLQIGLRKVGFSQAQLIVQKLISYHHPLISEGLIHLNHSFRQSARDSLSAARIGRGKSNPEGVSREYLNINVPQHSRDCLIHLRRALRRAATRKLELLYDLLQECSAPELLSDEVYPPRDTIPSDAILCSPLVIAAQPQGSWSQICK